MKKLIYILLIVPFFANGQDNIILKNGEEIASKVIEINENEIKYKNYSNINGPTYIKLKDDIFMIQYENGKTDLLNKQPVIQTYPGTGLKLILNKFSISEESYKFNGFEIEFFSEKNNNASYVIGFSTGKIFKNQIHFGINYYTNHQSKFIFKVSPSINFGSKEQLFYDSYSGFYVEEVSYSSFDLTFGPSYHLTKNLNISLEIGPSFLLSKENFEWPNPMILYIKPIMGIRF